MSTSYMLRTPMAKPDVLLSLPGWKWEKNKEYGVLLHGPGGYLHPDFDTGGDLVGFERYGGNDASEVVEALDCVSEHDDEDPDYERLFGYEEEQLSLPVTR